MEIKDKTRSLYFQSIAGHLFKMRGAPFFLSSKELDCIVEWEKMGIPLHVVLEGMKRSFETSRAQSKGKILTLSYCHYHVLKAFDQYRERRVGGEKRKVGRDEKRKRIQAEVQKFLSGLPSPIAGLRKPYLRAQKILTRTPLDEEELERLEAGIEELLLRCSTDEEKDKIKKEIVVEYELKEGEELTRIFRIKLVKLLREKYKIPYISPFYY